MFAIHRDLAHHPLIIRNFQFIILKQTSPVRVSIRG